MPKKKVEKKEKEKVEVIKPKKKKKSTKKTKTIIKYEIYGKDNKLIRTYEPALHGNNAEKLAQEFSKKNNYELRKAKYGKVTKEEEVKIDA